MFIGAIQKVYYSKHPDSPFIRMPDVFAVQWSIVREIDWTRGGEVEPNAGVLRIYGVILAYDPDIAETLADLTETGMGSGSRLKIVYKTSGALDSPVRIKGKIFHRVIFCTGGTEIRTDIEQQTLGKGQIHIIPFGLATKNADLIRDLIENFDA